MILYRKFFSKPDGVKAGPTKQTTLSFSSKSTNDSKAKATAAKVDKTNNDKVSHADKKASIKEEDSDVQMEDEVKVNASPNGKGA